MGRRGPLPKSERSVGAITPESLPPDRPTDLPGAAIEEWDRIIPMLSVSVRLRPEHRAVIVAYCQTWAMFVDMQKHIESEGFTVVVPIQTAKGESLGERRVPHPCLKALAVLRSSVLAFQRELGITPSSLARLSGNKPPPESTSPDSAAGSDRLTEIGKRVIRARGRSRRTQPAPETPAAKVD